MIPHTLTLTNFLSYRETAELDLRGIHLACISGLNGAGKSSILDAITWALFGKSRVGDDDIVNRLAAGQGKAAEVVFVFELEGAIYRVIRRKAVGKTTELELHVRGEGADGEPRWRVLTESKVRESKKAIEELLRMDYDIFTNASFLLQGKADEFTTKTPNRRKEILADILGVRQWDGYKALATERRKAVDIEITLLDRQMADIEAELLQEASRREELELAEAREAAVTSQQAAQEAIVAQLRRNQTLIEQHRQLLARATADLTQAQDELQRLERDGVRRRAELEEHRALLDRRDDIETAFAEWQAAEAEFSLWQERAEAYQLIRQELHPLEMALADIRARLEQRRGDLETRGREMTAAAAERESLSAQLAAGQARLAQLATRATEAAEQEQAWHDARGRLQTIESERKLWAQERDQLTAQATDAARYQEERRMMADSLETARQRLSRAAAELEQLAEQARKLADARTERAAIEAEQAVLAKQGQDTQDRIDRLEAEVGGDCPLCGQPLTADHRQQVLAELQVEVTALRARYKEGRSRIQALGEEIAALEVALRRQTTLEKERDTQQGAVGRHEARLHHLDESLNVWNSGNSKARLDELELALNEDDGIDALRDEIEGLRQAAQQAKQLTREHQILASELSRLETRCEQLERAWQRWEQVEQPELENITRQLAEQTYGQAERATLAAVESRLAAVGYDPVGHNTARSRRAEYEHAQEAYQQLRRAEAAVKPLSEGLEDVERRSGQLVARVTELRTHQDGLTHTLQELQAGAGDMRSAERLLAQLRDEQVAAIRATSAARQKVDVLEDLRREQDRLKEEKVTRSSRLSLLRQLEEACGRNGIQGLLIETALPDIEDHANDLLHRLSGGEMRIRFDTQRTGKTTGEQIETLDIKISDGTGERLYENYSGGEKFRINFAIRLALSQVLARRAGARLRTLVIDEGFGSQDPEGRQRLVEAINEVQQEFACILVITHIDELRDKFPARIDVEKTPTGSRLSVVEV